MHKLSYMLWSILDKSLPIVGLQSTNPDDHVYHTYPKPLAKSFLFSLIPPTQRQQLVVQSNRISAEIQKHVSHLLLKTSCTCVVNINALISTVSLISSVAVDEDKCVFITWLLWSHYNLFNKLYPQLASHNGL